jgi:hypothetical protein
MADYRLGALLGVATAFLLSVQEPMSSLAARQLDGDAFVLVTQVSLALSVPLLLGSARARRDLGKILGQRSSYPRLAVIFALGMTGLVLYKLGLAGAHPIIIAAIFNLSPFWAAIVARLVTGTRIPVATPIFAICLTAAFCGAMTVAWSQLRGASAGGDMMASLLRGSWVFAVPIPILSALNGTLIAKWFGEFDERAAIAVNFLAPAVVLIPLTGLWVAESGAVHAADAPAILLMMLGSVVAASFGRVVYQIALTATAGDNGFVTMFFLLVPALTGLVSWPLSLAIPSLAVHIDIAFFSGLALIAGALVVFSLAGAYRAAPAAP